MTNVVGWAEALAEVLLPRGAAGRPVRLACDEEVVRAAGRRLGIPAARAVTELARTVKYEYGVSQRDGVKGLVRASMRDRKRPDRTRAPEALAALSLAVLAANRMDSGQHASAREYYPRFREVMEIPQFDGAASVQDFELMRTLLDQLAAWLREDLRGDRGILDQPGVHGMPRIGPVIDQTLLRQRDRYLLSEFYADSAARIAAGVDPVGLLRTWGERHRLTRVGRATIDDPNQAPALASLLRAGAERWDGTRVSADGVREVRARLELVFTVSGIALGIAHPELSGPIELRSGDGWSATVPRDGTAPMPLEWLPRMTRGVVRLEVVDEQEVLALPHADTLLFRLDYERGLVLTARAEEEPVWVLSAALWARSEEFSADRRQDITLPGWVMLDGVEPARLPGELRRTPSDRAPAARLVGGLALGGHLWLSRHPPRLALGELGGATVVRLDGEIVARANPHAEISLGPAAANPGAHQVRLGDGAIALDFNVAETVVGEGGAPAWGTLSWPLDDPAALRQGPIARDAARRVCGAALHGITEAVGGREVLIAAAAGRVHVLHTDGRWTQDAPPTELLDVLRTPTRDFAPEHGWRLRHADTAAWVLIEGPPARVLCVCRDAPFELAPAYAAYFGEAEVMDPAGVHDPEAERVWRECCRAAAQGIT